MNKKENENSTIFLSNNSTRIHSHAKIKTHHKIKHKHGNGSSIDYYAYISKINHWNSSFKVFFSISTLLLCLILNNPFVSIAIIMAMFYLTVFKGKLPASDYLSVLTIPLTFILLGTITIGIDFAKEPIGQYNLFLGLGYAFTSLAKLKEMFFLILKVFGAISTMEMMALSTPSTEIISVLKKAHLPKLIIELMNLIYRYIFILMDVHSKMKNSAESRLGFRNFKTSCFTFGNIASSMLIVSLKKANTYYSAMESRCYDGDLLFLEEDKKLEMAHIIIAGGFFLFLILIWFLTTL
ncbi:MAG: cobalt ECF transporter T component CbiQ [Bacilli bacterium]